MTIWELLALAVGLSMDAFAVAVCKGLAMPAVTPGKACVVGAWFGGFQAGMPLLGWLLGTRFSAYIAAYDHWIALALLVFIGGNMIRESLDTSSQDKADNSLAFKAMLVMALATSIDALAVGVTFAFLQVRVLPAALLIGAITFGLSSLGVKVGNLFGLRYKRRAELFGGVILILLGVKILLEHLGLL